MDFSASGPSNLGFGPSGNDARMGFRPVQQRRPRSFLCDKDCVNRNRGRANVFQSCCNYETPRRQTMNQQGVGSDLGTFIPSAATPRRFREMGFPRGGRGFGRGRRGRGRGNTNNNGNGNGNGNPPTDVDLNNNGDLDLDMQRDFDLGGSEFN